MIFTSTLLFLCSSFFLLAIADPVEITVNPSCDTSADSSSATILTSSDALLTSVELWLQGTSAPVSVNLLAGGNIVATSELVVIDGTQPAWVKFQFTAPPTVNAKTSYTVQLSSYPKDLKAGVCSSGLSLKITTDEKSPTYMRELVPKCISSGYIDNSGQSFTSEAGTIISVSFILQGNTVGQSILSAQIGPSSDAVSATSYPVSIGKDDTPTWIEFVFQQPLQVVAGKMYYINIKQTLGKPSPVPSKCADVYSGGYANLYGTDYYLTDFSLRVNYLATGVVSTPESEKTATTSAGGGGEGQTSSTSAPVGKKSTTESAVFVAGGPAPKALPLGAIIGIVVGSVMFVILMIILIVVLVSSRKSSSIDSEPSFQKI